MDRGTAAQRGYDMESTDALLAQLLQEQQRTNQLLLMLIEAMGEAEEVEAGPATYMDGSPVI